MSLVYALAKLNDSLATGVFSARTYLISPPIFNASGPRRRTSVNHWNSPSSHHIEEIITHGRPYRQASKKRHTEESNKGLDGKNFTLTRPADTTLFHTAHLNPSYHNNRITGAKRSCIMGEIIMG